MKKYQTIKWWSKWKKNKNLLYGKVSVFLLFFFLVFSFIMYILGFHAFFTSLIFPVNDHIFQFNKVILLSFLIWSVFEKITIRKKHDLNTCTSGLIASLSCSFFFMLFYIPIYVFIFHYHTNLFAIFAIYFIGIIISVALNYHLLQRKYNSELEKKIILGWFFVIIFNAILTFYHPDYFIF